ncbi:hypothetical protein VNO77_20322 [Canavalia gladiata]|uniref:Uncharacterized protein n=1 Tax=Canavalia gladiata TaxID=3824 RepID=A0AAN9LPA7_CANGL
MYVYMSHPLSNMNLVICSNLLECTFPLAISQRSMAEMKVNMCDIFVFTEAQGRKSYDKLPDGGVEV